MADRRPEVAPVPAPVLYAASLAGLVSVEVEDRSELVGVRVAGEVDLAGFEVLEDALVFALACGRDIDVDFSALTFVDSSGLNVLIRAWRKADASGHRVRLLGANPLVQKVLEVSGAQSILNGRGEPPPDRSLP